jgi:hypothetical protein
MHAFSNPGEREPHRRTSSNARQDRIRDPALTALLVLELCAIFLAAPLAANGLLVARTIAETMLITVLVIVVLLSQQLGATLVILLGLTAVAASLLLSRGWSPLLSIALHRGGDVLTFAALTWVVGRAVYAPGRITSHRLQGAIVIYLNLATIFAGVYSLIWELNPGAFVNLVVPSGGPKEVAIMLYFSLTSLTTTGYGDIVAVDPFARSLANLEAVIGQFFIAITVARLVTMELEDRRRRLGS